MFVVTRPTATLFRNSYSHRYFFETSGMPTIAPLNQDSTAPSETFGLLQGPITFRCIGNTSAPVGILPDTRNIPAGNVTVPSNS